MICWIMASGEEGLKNVNIHCSLRVFNIMHSIFIFIIRLYKERLSQVDAKLQEVIAGKAPEYLEPLAALQENMQIRTKVAGKCMKWLLLTQLGIYRELCLESVKNKYECEIQASRQHCEAMATLGPHRVKTEPPVKLEKHLHNARSEEGRLYYNGEWYGRGQTICIDRKDECPTSAIITTINHDEVWFKRPDGSKSKLYISQLQKGKYSIKHNHN
ncbi:hypothetical protein JD844_021094 [Phrynosoma platyrhinos]|uniref:Breast cancer metastasis-suppressor 1-like protein n=1 Tax=Phrynosoma platyrhinos TaxID=52577 RepID=A0ABQ7ST34_PHRPL|nr:hypothetical protein JD844_021094 [Phrynosoma platyrhinos]